MFIWLAWTFPNFLFIFSIMRLTWFFFLFLNAQSCRIFSLELSINWVGILCIFLHFKRLFKWLVTSGWTTFQSNPFQGQIIWTTWGSWRSSFRSKHLMQELVHPRLKRTTTMRSQSLWQARRLKLPQRRKQRNLTLLLREFYLEGLCVILYIFYVFWAFILLFRVNFLLFYLILPVTLDIVTFNSMFCSSETSENLFTLSESGGTVAMAFYCAFCCKSDVVGSVALQWNRRLNILPVFQSLFLAWFDEFLFYSYVVSSICWGFHFKVFEPLWWVRVIK